MTFKTSKIRITSKNLVTKIKIIHKDKIVFLGERHGIRALMNIINKKEIKNFSLGDDIDTYAITSDYSPSAK